MGTGVVQGVLGPIDRADLGFTLPHEHVLHDLLGGARSLEEKVMKSDTVAAAVGRFSEQERAARSVLWDQQITMENLGDVRRNYHFYGESLRILDVDEASEDAVLFKGVGGGCIVDGTVHGMGRSPQGLVEVSRRSGVHIVASTGFYLYPYLPPEVAAMSEDEALDRLLRDLSDDSESGVRAGALGEIGLSGPVHPVEEKMLRAAARAQAETGVGLAVHPGPGLDGALAARPHG